MFTITNESIKMALEATIAKVNFKFNVVIHDETPQEQFEMLANFVDLSKYKKEDLLCAGTTYCSETDGRDEVKFFIDGIYEAIKRSLGLVFPLKEIADQYLSSFINVIVQHEYRHSEQFQYLRSIGGSNLLQRILGDEINATYGNGLLENDAISYSNGNIKSLDEVFKNI